MSKPIIDRRPWGSVERFTLNERTTVKLLYVNAGHRLSYQYHNKRSEFWKVVRGKIRIVLNDKTKILSEGDTATVPLKALHRIEGIKSSVILEIAYGKFEEGDIVRLKTITKGRRKQAISPEFSVNFAERQV